MWTQQYTPFVNLTVSALVAAVPILFFLLGLTVLKLSGMVAAAISTVLALIAAAAAGMPITAAAGAGLFGVLSGLWPIAWIIVMAVWLYKVTVASGKFDVIRGSISGISPDQRVQVLLIAFCFGSFLEGAAGFGVPIAICAALLVELGFRPVRAAMICLVANAAFGAYGAIGIPVIVGAQQSGVPLAALSTSMVVVLQLVTVAIPALLVAIVDGRRGLRETWPLAVTLGVVFSGLQTLLLVFLGPEMVDIVPGLVGMVLVAGFTRVWRPRHVYRECGAPVPPADPRTAGQVVGAWSPFYVLTAFILVWSLPAFKALFAAGGALAGTLVAVPVPGLHHQVARGAELGGGDPLAAIWTWTPLNATGTAILLAVLVTWAISPTVRFADLIAQLRATLRELWKPIVLILLVMAVATIANFSGGSATIGLALAAVGAAFPLLSPVIGWFGVFITGSVVNNNNLFAGLQAVTAGQIGVDPSLLVAANTAGGVMAKVVSPQSIAIAAGAVGLSGREGEILRAALRYSLGLLGVVCVWTLVLSLI